MNFVDGRKHEHFKAAYLHWSCFVYGWSFNSVPFDNGIICFGNISFSAVWAIDPVCDCRFICFAVQLFPDAGYFEHSAKMLFFTLRDFSSSASSLLSVY